jgi:hypothetical protein
MVVVNDMGRLHVMAAMAHQEFRETRSSNVRDIAIAVAAFRQWENIAKGQEAYTFRMV